MRNLKINIITMGCSKNLVDSEQIYTQIKASGIDVYHESVEECFDAVIINTCGFIHDAKKESIDTILHFSEKKKSGKINKLIVCGCLTERYREDIAKSIPEIDKIFGVGELKEILKYLKLHYKAAYYFKRSITTPNHYAYLKIAEGCNRKCSFCSIPMIRGKYISEQVDDLIKQVKFLASGGVKELLLIAQDSTYYGKDIDEKKGLSKLLEKLSDINGIEWIRLMYAYPSQFPIEILDCIRDYPKICKYIDIPFQHINDRILKDMKRGIDEVGTYRLIEKIRKTVPDIAIRTSLIVGFPGETRSEYVELYNFVKEVRFERMGVFQYSEEEGTYAASFKDSVSKTTKENRATDLMKLQEKISFERNSKLLGQNLKVIIDSSEGDKLLGRTEWDAPEIDNEVIIERESYDIKQGSFAEVKIESFDAYELFGKIVKNNQ